MIRLAVEQVITVEEALEIAEEVLAQGCFNKVQALVFCQSWEGQSYSKIATSSSYDPGYIKDVGSKLWQSLSEALGEKVTKHNFQSVLKRLARQREQSEQSELKSLVSNDDRTLAQHNWGEAIDVSVFYGRTEELQLLQEWILQSRNRLVAILGMGGMGKTALSVKLGQHVQHDFEFLLWQSLGNAPPFDELAGELMQFLSNQQELQLPETLSGKIARLIHYLHSSRCLLILDNYESVFQSGSQTGKYRQGYEGYGQFLKSVGEVAHSSCVVITSREKPREVGLLEGLTSPVKSLQLQGLTPAEGRSIFIDKGCYSSENEDWLEIFEHYTGNPLALKMVASGVQELFDGDLACLLPYLRQGQLGFADINELLGQQFDRLSVVEHQIINWLTVNREPVSLPELEADIVSEAISRQLLGGLRSLVQRSLIEKTEKRWFLQPAILEYATVRLVSFVCEDIIHQKAELLSDYALVKAQSKDYIRQAQIRLILQPVIEQLLFSLRSYKKIQQHLEAIANKLRAEAPLAPGYLGGNLLNFLAAMQVDLSDYDFSHLTISQADLQNVSLYNVNFSHCHFSKSIFAESFGGVLAIAFSPDGQFLATGNANSEIHLWQVSDRTSPDKSSRQHLFTLEGHKAWVRNIAFSPDGSLLASVSEDRTVKLWDLKDGKFLSTLYECTQSLYAITFNANGTLLATGGNDCTLRIWDPIKGDCKATLMGHTQGILSVDFSSNGKYLASSGFDNTIRIWDVATGTCLQVLTDHDHWVGSVQFSSDSQKLLSASCDRTLRIWNLNGKCTSIFKGHTGWIWRAFWSPDGKLIASCSEDQTLKIWDVKTRACLHTLLGHSSRVWGLSFSPDGETIASCSEDQTIRLWQVNNGRCVANIQGYTNWVRTVAFSPSNEIVATGHKDCTLRVWDVNTGRCLRELKAHTRGIPAVAFHPNGEILASGSEDTTIKLWNLADGRCIHVLEKHTNEVWSLSFSPDGQILASSSFDKTVKLWDVGTGECIDTLTGHSDRVPSVKFNPQGTLLASGSDDCTIKLWDVGTGECIRTFEGHTGRVGAIAFSPDGSLLASPSLDGTVKIWDVAEGECLCTFEGHAGWVMSVAFYPDSQKIASGSCDQTIKIWDVFEGTCLNTLTGHTNWIWGVAISPEASMLASASEDETIRIWNAHTQTCLATLRARRPYEGMRMKGATGLTPAQKQMLSVLGAV